jgi:S-adenosylhomocysteine hydrolase
MRDSAILPGERPKTMESAVHLLPKEIDDEGPRIKLNAVGIGVNALTSKQEEIRLNAATG